MELLILNIFAILYAILDAWHDSLLYKRSSKWHTVDATIKTFVLFVVAYYAFNSFPVSQWGAEWFEYVMVVLIGLSWRYLLFNFLYGWFTGLGVLYLGNSAWMDRTFRGFYRVCLMMLGIFFLIAFNFYLS